MVRYEAVYEKLVSVRMASLWVQFCLDTRDAIRFCYTFCFLSELANAFLNQHNQVSKLNNWGYYSKRSVLLLGVWTLQSKKLVYYASYSFESVQKLIKFEAEIFGLIFQSFLRAFESQNHLNKSDDI